MQSHRSSRCLCVVNGRRKPRLSVLRGPPPGSSIPAVSTRTAVQIRVAAHRHDSTSTAIESKPKSPYHGRTRPTSVIVEATAPDSSIHTLGQYRTAHSEHITYYQLVASYPQVQYQQSSIAVPSSVPGTA
eukprot:1889590-Rhodomonas_salina.1